MRLPCRVGGWEAWMMVEWVLVLRLLAAWVARMPAAAGCFPEGRPGYVQMGSVSKDGMAGAC